MKAFQLVIIAIALLASHSAMADTVYIKESIDFDLVHAADSAKSEEQAIYEEIKSNYTATEISASSSFNMTDEEY